VLIAIVLVVESSPRGVRVHHGNLDHSFLLLEHTEFDIFP
jgi:hypothetical protein